jgi:RNA polymerase sigma factor (sigma-70 family)
MKINVELDDLIRKTVSEVMNELRKQGLLKENNKTPFQKTELLLYNYQNFKNTIDHKYQEIENIRKDGVPKKSGSIRSFHPGGSKENQSELEKCEEMIDAISESIKLTEKFIGIIDNALDSLKDDPYFEIIPMKYFEGLPREEIADCFECDVRTVSRNKNRLINLLQIRLFSDEFIYSLFH